MRCVLAGLATPERGVRRTECRCTRPTSDHGDRGTVQLEEVDQEMMYPVDESLSHLG